MAIARHMRRLERAKAPPPVQSRTVMRRFGPTGIPLAVRRSSVELAKHMPREDFRVTEDDLSRPSRGRGKRATQPHRKGSTS